MKMYYFEDGYGETYTVVSFDEELAKKDVERYLETKSLEENECNKEHYKWELDYFRENKIKVTEYDFGEVLEGEIS